MQKTKKLASLDACAALLVALAALALSFAIACSGLYAEEAHAANPAAPATLTPEQVSSDMVLIEASGNIRYYHDEETDAQYIMGPDGLWHIYITPSSIDSSVFCEDFGYYEEGSGLLHFRAYNLVWHTAYQDAKTGTWYVMGPDSRWHERAKKLGGFVGFRDESTGILYACHSDGKWYEALYDAMMGEWRLGRPYGQASNIISLANADVAVKERAWTGKKLTPASVTVKLNGRTLTKGTDYTVSCKGGKAVGAYKVTIAGKGSYTGAKAAEFKIVPKAVSGAKAKGAKRSVKVTWKAPSKAARAQVTGYQVRCSASKSMKDAVAVKVKGASKTSATLTKAKDGKKAKKLKAGKKYYVQVRAYKTVKGKTYYSAWSKAKAVKTKK